MTWSPVPVQPAYEYRVNGAAIGGFYVKVRTKSQPEGAAEGGLARGSTFQNPSSPPREVVLHATVHVRKDDAASVRDAVAVCVGKIEAAR